MSKLNTSPPTSNVGISANASEPSTSRNDSGADVKFKCNICLELPVDAVVTRCGHLVCFFCPRLQHVFLFRSVTLLRLQYCWECLHNWLERGAVQCPVCKAGVSRSDVVPVYGSESDHRPHPAVTAASESSSRCRSEEQPRQRIPERPRAERPEPPRSAAASSASATSQGWVGLHRSASVCPMFAILFFLRLVSAMSCFHCREHTTFNSGSSLSVLEFNLGHRE